MVQCVIFNLAKITTTKRSQIALCKRIHEGPGFRIPASGFQPFGFRIPTFWISDSIPNEWIPDSGFQPIMVPDSSLWIPDSNSKNLLDPDLLHGASQTLSACHFVARAAGKGILWSVTEVLESRPLAFVSCTQLYLRPLH